MENANFSHGHLEPTNGEENSNLQNNSEENTKDESVGKEIPKHFSGLSDIIPEEEEEERRRQDDDRELLERMNEEERDPNREHKSDEIDEQSEKDDNHEGQPEEVDDQKQVRDYRGSNKKLAGFVRVRSQKQGKYERLVSEMDDLKADLKRGYRIVTNDEGSVNHIPITSSENMVISFKISDLDFERFMLRFEIADLDQAIKQLASRKRTNRITKKKKVARSKQEDKLVKQVTSAMTKASKNGSTEIVSQIQQQAQAGKDNEAYDSLKSFLSQKVKTVSKKLSKSPELEKNVLGKVIDKLSPSES